MLRRSVADKGREVFEKCVAEKCYGGVLEESVSEKS